MLGILKDILKNRLHMVNLAGETLRDMEKTVVLQFDEVKVKTMEEYVTSKDEVIGPHNQM